MKKSPIVVSMRNVHKSFVRGELTTEVLHDVSFDIAEGEFVAIIGPSGSGKSTLMNLIGCLDVPTDGTYFLEGQNIADLAPDELARLRNTFIGFVFQQFNLLADLDAVDNVALPLLYAGIPTHEARQRAIQLLTTIGLGDRLGNYPYQLSGGQQQRVSIARALANTPALILADEPTGNLDSQSGTAVMKVFEDLHKAGKTIVMVTHDPHLAKKADRQIVIQDGTIVKDTRTRQQ